MATWSKLCTVWVVSAKTGAGLDELIEKIEAVTVDDLQGLAQEFFKTESIAVTALGNLSGLKISRDQLAC